jgi:RNA polymerase sigma-70 factor (ECF subfamily)
MKRRRSVFAPAPGKELSLDEVMPAKVARDGQVRLEIADWSQVPEQQAMNTQLRGMLEAAIRQLPENYRSVVLLRDVEQLSTKEAAGILDLGEDVVKQRLHRGRLALRKALEGQLKGASSGRG